MKESNPIIEIIGAGNQSAAADHLRQILSGYSQYAVRESCMGNSAQLLDEATYNIDVLSDLLRYVLTCK